VKSLLKGHVLKGHYQCLWDGTDKNGTTVANGIYFASLSSKSGRVINKMLILK